MTEVFQHSLTDWNEFRALEAKRHKEFFLPMYPRLGMKVIQDIFDDTKTNDYDVIVEYHGKRYKVDEKARNKDYGDLLVEVMECLRDGRLGWLYKKIDYLFYASWAKPEEEKPFSAYIVRMPNLKEFVIENWDELPEHFSKKGYGLTMNKKVAWRDLEYLKIAKRIV